jgi:lytic murein transglycosylase
MRAKELCLSISVTAAIALSASSAWAASCSNTAAGFDSWKSEIKSDALAAGIKDSTVDKVLASVSYSKATIRADRGQKSFKLTLDEFLKKRGAATIVSRGKKMKSQNAALFNSIEKRYGVPAGPLIAIWGMETGFGSFLGNEHTLSAVATLSFDCRRSDYFTEQFMSAMKLVQRGDLALNAKGAAHGEIGQTQFLPKNVILYGVDGDGNGHVDMVNSRADAMASTANFLKGHGWQPGAGYQQGEPNYAAIQGWNAATVYQQAIALMGAQIDGLR